MRNCNASQPLVNSHLYCITANGQRQSCSIVRLVYPASPYLGLQMFFFLFIFFVSLAGATNAKAARDERD
jgi:hypothetical protein